MQVSKIFAQQKINFGAQSTTPNQVSQKQPSPRNGDIAASLDALAAIGKSTVIAREPVETEEKDYEGRLTRTREIRNNQIIDTYYDTVYEAVSRTEFRPLQVEGEPEDRSCTIYFYWEDGKHVSNVYKYDKKGDLVDSEEFDRPSSSDDEGSPYADFVLY